MTELFPAGVLDAPGPALVIDGAPLERRELLRAALAHGRSLREAGLRPGSRVAVVAQGHPATIAAVLGNALAGFVTVPLNPALGERELAHVMGDAAPAAVLAADPEAASRFPGCAPIRTGGRALPSIHEGAPGDPLLVLYTSGTTGLPKGAVLTRENVAANLAALAEAWGWSSSDVLVHALPLFHVHGLVLGVLGALRAGSTLRLLPRFVPEAIATAFEAGATVLFAVPTMVRRLADHLETQPAAARAVARARLLVSGSAGLPLREHARFERITGRRIVERYGLTETLIVTAVRPGAPSPAGTVGTPLAGVEVRLGGDDGPTGEVLVRGPNVFAGYLGRPEATAAALAPEGFFRTGDLGTFEPGGHLRLLGRLATDLIKTGGYKVGAGEVEAALLEFPGVIEAAVLGLPDEDLGERIVAFVVVQPGSGIAPGALVEHVARLASPHKRPREVHLVPELPRNAMGKVLKAELRGRITPGGTPGST